LTFVPVATMALMVGLDAVSTLNVACENSEICAIGSIGGAAFPS